MLQLMNLVSKWDSLPMVLYQHGKELAKELSSAVGQLSTNDYANFKGELLVVNLEVIQRKIEPPPAILTHKVLKEN